MFIYQVERESFYSRAKCERHKEKVFSKTKQNEHRKLLELFSISQHIFYSFIYVFYLLHSSTSKHFFSFDARSQRTFFCRISFDTGSTIQNMNAYWQHNRAITSKFYSAFTVAGPSVLPRWMFREWFCSWIHASSSEYTRRTCGLWTAAWMIHRVRSVQLRLRYRQILYFVCVDLS